MQPCSQTGDPDQQQMPPTISAALVDSLFMNPAPYDLRRVRSGDWPQ